MMFLIKRFGEKASRRTKMGNKIKWESEMNGALVRARSENKHVVLDFFNPA